MKTDHYDAFAEAYDAENASSLVNAHYERPAMIALAGDVRGRRILDAGCGSGPLSAALRERGAEMTGFDGSPAMIELARRRLGGGVPLQTADLAEPLPYDDESFDDVVASLVLHYLEDWSAPRAELRRVLRPGGRLIMSVNHPTVYLINYPDQDYFVARQFTEEYEFLDSAGTAVPGYAATLLTVLEIPGIIVGLLLANRHAARHVGWAGAVHEVLAGKSIVLLVGGLLLGWAIGEEGYAPVEPLFGDPFRGVLTLFLLGLGIETGTRLRSVRAAGFGLVLFALVFPLAAGALGVVAGALIGMPEGGSAILGVLCASASYIAAPAAVRYSLPEANPAIPLSASLGVTFPVNLVVGIPLIAQLAAALAA